MKQLSGFRFDLYRRRPLQNQLKKISPAFWIRFSDDAAIAHPPAESIFFVAIWILAAPFNTNTKLVGAAAKGYSHFLLIKNDIRLVVFFLQWQQIERRGKKKYLFCFCTALHQTWPIRSQRFSGQQCCQSRFDILCNTGMDYRIYLIFFLRNA